MKKAITIQEEAEKIAQVVTVMAHQGTRYTLEKQVFVQASHAEQSWQVPFTPKDSFAAAAQESARAWQTLWQQANITVTGDLMSQNFYGFTVITCWLRLRLLVTKRKHWTSRLPPEACMVKRIVDIFSGMKFLFYLLYSTLS